MKKLNRLPHEEERNAEDPTERNSDGLPVEGDVEGHRQPSADRFLPRVPGTGGDIHRPVGGGEVEGDDVEGHALPRLPGTGGDVAPRLPGTGGDQLRRPVGGGEIAVDTEDPGR